MANTPKNILMAVVCTLLAITLGQQAFGNSNNIHGLYLAESTMSTPGEPPTPTVTVGCGSSTARRATPPGGVTYYWQGTNSGGTSTANSALTYTVTTSGTYYLRARDNTSYAWSPPRSFYVTVKPRPQTPQGADAMRAGNGSLNLSVTHPTSGSTARWYHEGTLVTSGENNYTTPHLTSTRTYTVKSMKDGCESSGSRSLSAIVTTTPTVAVGCGTSVLTRTSTPLPSGLAYYWQTTSGGTSTANSFTTFNVNSTGWYYLRARRTDGVWSTGFASVYASVKPFPETPQGNDVMREDPGRVTLSVTHPTTGASAKWYENGTLVATGENNYTTPPLTVTKIYTVRSIKDGCESSIATAKSLKAIVTTAFDAGGATSAGGYSNTQFIYTHTKDYFGPYNVPGKDIFYRVELPVAGHISAQISGTAAAYSLHLLNSSFQHIETSFGGQMTNSNQGAGIYYIVTAAQLASTTGNVTTHITVTLPHVNAAPTTTQNYILTTTMMVPEEPTRLGDMQQSVTYYDGLGRPEQSIQVKASPTGRDIVQPIYYDNLGRQNYQILPYSTIIDGSNPNNNGAYRTNAWKPELAASEARTFYLTTSQSMMPGDHYPFAETEFDNSPLNRVTEQGAPGANWQPASSGATGSGKTIKYSYGSNASADAVRKWQVGSNNSMSSSDTYADNTLYKLETLDEDNNLTIEFKDLQGRIVASDAYDKNNNDLRHRTQYVYDDFGRLRYVLSPEFTSPSGSFTKTHADIKRWCYYYEYDARGRMIEKQLPGADVIEMVYDNRDRLIATRDGVQRNKPTNKEWTVMMYDNLNRVAYTAILFNSAARTTMEQAVAGWSGNVTRTANSLGYSLLAIPNITNGTPAYLHATYYDDYNFPLNGLTTSFDQPDTQYPGDRHSQQVRGLVTGERVLVLEAGVYLHSMYFYDEKGRVIQTKQQRYYGTPTVLPEITSTFYHFNGQVERTRTRHTSPAGGDQYIYQRYAYDHAWRPTRTYHKIGTGAEILTSNLAYNELGQLKEKKLHKENMASYQQVTDYRYNIRGWLTKINDPDAMKPADLFGMRLNYNETFSQISAATRFNGNISSVSWKHSENSATQAYKYEYDGLNRLTGSQYATRTGSTWSLSSAFRESISLYDRNGNIKSLSRTNASGVATNYSFTHTGNQLNTVNGGTSFTYDQNGNMTNHRLQGFAVTYNQLNLPKTVSKSTESIGYIYSATGEKLGKRETNNTYIYYSYPFVYSNSSSTFTLDYILFDEGTIAYEGSTYTYQYNLKDHLGNTRTVFKPTATGPQVLQKSDYYPFGMAHNLQNTQINKYLYNGKEIQDDVLGGTAFNWYDYGARFYDPQIARFHSVDPKTEEYSFQSPYTYAANNPILFIDENGENPSRGSRGAYLWPAITQELRRKTGFDLNRRDDPSYLRQYPGRVASAAMNEVRETASYTAQSPMMVGFLALLAAPVAVQAAGSATVLTSSVNASGLSSQMAGLIGKTVQIGDKLALITVNNAGKVEIILGVTSGVASEVFDLPPNTLPETPLFYVSEGATVFGINMGREIFKQLKEWERRAEQNNQNNQQSEDDDEDKNNRQ